MLQIKVQCLAEMLKVYLMATGGCVDKLGGLSCGLLDAMDCMCRGDEAHAGNTLTVLTITVAKSVYLSAIERMESLDDPGVGTHKAALARINDEKELLPHLLFLKSIMVDLGVVTKTDHSLMTRKIQELIAHARS